MQIAYMKLKFKLDETLEIVSKRHRAVECEFNNIHKKLEADQLLLRKHQKTAERLHGEVQ